MNSDANKIRVTQKDKKPLACRILVLGDTLVGKSAIIYQFLKREIPTDKNRTVQSHEENFICKKNELTLSISEFGGNSSILRDWNIARADAFILVYSLLEENSFETVRCLKERICQIKHDEHIPVVVVANKTDLYKKEVSVWRTVAELSTCLDWNWVHVEMSATSDDKMADVFQNVLTQVGIEFSFMPSPKPRFLPRLNIRRFSLMKKYSPGMNYQQQN